jgi:hypothetical protein
MVGGRVKSNYEENFLRKNMNFSRESMGSRDIKEEKGNLKICFWVGLRGPEIMKDRWSREKKKERERVCV